jgi:deoxyadenosine/deoxycytidine kinase
MQYKYLAVEGPIGVGKTSFAEMLAERLRFKLLSDPADNPFIGEFYDAKAGAAFRAQLFFLLERHDRLTRARQPGLYEQGTVADFLFERDRLFAHLNLTGEELEIYDKLYPLLNERLATPDLVIYLTAPVEVLLKRIRGRARAYERRLSEDYLAGVAEAYARHFHRWNATPLIVINTQDIDFVKRPHDMDDLVRRIEKHQGGTLYYTPQSQG